MFDFRALYCIRQKPAAIETNWTSVMQGRRQEFFQGRAPGEGSQPFFNFQGGGSTPIFGRFNGQNERIFGPGGGMAPLAYACLRPWFIRIVACPVLSFYLFILFIPLSDA